jgi:hypothetical protein
MLANVEPNLIAYYNAAGLSVYRPFRISGSESFIVEILRYNLEITLRLSGFRVFGLSGLSEL